MDRPVAKIRDSGRWKSDAYLQYVRLDVFKLPRRGPPEEFRGLVGGRATS